MKKIFLLPAFFILASGIFISCQKENSCEGCIGKNKPPIAIAGPDQVITLPTDNISLDGSSSSDPDGTISEWLWTKISGPASFNPNSQTTAKTIIENLDTGIYHLELKVTDNDGLFSKDTLKIFVNSITQVNRLPVTNAGPDQYLTQSTNSVTLNGSESFDPDNNITSYEWRKISGPTSYDILNATAVQAQAINLVEGSYEFELKITDAAGEVARDSILIFVSGQEPVCNNSNRPRVNAHLTPVGTLSQARFGMAVASAGNKIVFAGASLSAVDGSPVADYGSSRVDIYDIVTHAWTTAELSEKRSDIAAVAAGNKIFFAGGRLGDGAFDQLFSTVDIYDVSSNTWSVASLSQPRAYIAAAAVGNKVLFAGGEKNHNYNTSDVVDIYNTSANSWSTAILSNARAYISAVTVNDKVYFAGGHREDRWYAEPSTRIDIYDNSSNSWSALALIQPMGFLSGISVSEKIYWAEGCQMEIKNVKTWSSDIANLFQPGSWVTNEGQNAVEKDGKIILFRPWTNSHDKFDIYDIANDTWSIGVLPVNIAGASIVAVNNTIYLAGGVIDGNFSTLSNQVWKLEF